MANSFYCELNGLDSALKKISKIQNMDGSKPLQEIAEEASQSLKANTASAGFVKSSQSCKVVAKKGKYLDVGYSSDFNAWKELWYQHWGYAQWAWGRPTGYKTTVHVGVFDEIRHMTIQEVKPVLERRVQQYLRQIINE